MGSEDDVPPEVGPAHCPEEGVEGNDGEGIHEAQALVGVVHGDRVVPPPGRPAQGEEVGDAAAEPDDGLVPGEVGSEHLAEAAVVDGGIGRPKGPLGPGDLGVQEPAEGLMDGLDAEGGEEAGVVLVEVRWPGGDADAALDGGIAVDGWIGTVRGEVPLEGPGVAADLAPGLVQGDGESLPLEGPGGSAARDAPPDDGHGAPLPSIVAVAVAAAVAVLDGRGGGQGLCPRRPSRHGHGKGPGQQPPQGRDRPSHQPDGAPDRHPEWQSGGDDDDLPPGPAQKRHAPLYVGFGIGELPGPEGIGLGEPPHGQRGQPLGRLGGEAMDGVVAEEVIEIKTCGR